MALMSGRPRLALDTAQPGLFDLAPEQQAALPPGLLFTPAFVSAAEEAALLAMAAALPLHEARYKTYTARRRVHAWGSRFDFEDGLLRVAPVAELPAKLHALRDRLAVWVGVAPGDFGHVLVSEYRPGTPLGWHRDAPGYEVVAGVSLGGPARLRFRPWPHAATDDDIVVLDLAPRSAYVMRGPARWAWQHSLPPVPALRYSVTMRTLRG